MERFYDLKEDTNRIVLDVEKFTKELRERVEPNMVRVFNTNINSFNFVITYENNPCLGESYSLQYNGIEAIYQFRGHIIPPQDTTF